MNRGWQESGTMGGDCRDLRNCRDYRDGATGRAAACGGRHAGYTLIELVSVAALAVVLIGISVGGYHLWTRDTAVDAAQRQVRASLTRARAFALARGVETRFVAINSNKIFRCFTVLDYRASNDVWVSFTATNPLPKYIYLDMKAMRSTDSDPIEDPRIFFNSDGTPRWDEDLYDDPGNEFLHHLRLVLVHSPQTDRAPIYLSDPKSIHRYLDISRLTGLVREVPP